MVLRKIVHQYESSYQTRTKCTIGFGNNEVPKTLTQNFYLRMLPPTPGGSKIALPERCSGQLKMTKNALHVAFTPKTFNWMEKLSKTTNGNAEIYIWLNINHYFFQVICFPNEELWSYNHQIMKAVECRNIKILKNCWNYQKIVIP